VQQVSQIPARGKAHRNHQAAVEMGSRMGKALEAITAATTMIMQAHTRLQNIEWPTVDRPR